MVVWRWGRKEGMTEGHCETFRMEDLFIILTEVTISGVNTCVEIYKAIRVKSMQFIACQLPMCSLLYVNYLNKVFFFF